jgi:amino acid adenylation domain-containing protein
MTLPGELSESARALLTRRAAMGSVGGPERRVDQGPAPLATPQLAQWLFDEVHSAGAASGLPKRLHLAGTLNRDALRRALSEIVRRHQVLRSAFTVVDGEPVQRITAPRTIELPECDLRSVVESERPAAAEALLEEDARRGFDLASGQLLRPLLVRLGDDAWELQVCVPHVAFDGWSNGIFLRELGVLYSAYAAGISSPLPELPLQYADFAAWERATEGGGSYDADSKFWRAYLAGSTSAIDIPPDHPRRRDRAGRIGRVTEILPEPLTTRLAALAAEENATLFALTFAAFQVLVGRRAGQDDFVLGAVSANRGHRTIEDLIGSFMTVLPLRARLADAPSFRIHLRRTMESLSEAFLHQAYPFQRLLADLRPGADSGIEPIFHVVFNYRNMPVCLPVMDGLGVSNFRAPHLSARFDFHLNLTPSAGALQLELEYDADLFEAATATRWLAGYRALLEAVAADPETSTADLPIMPAGERQRVLSEWSLGVRIPTRCDRTAGELFLEQARQTPAATAVIGSDETWTFKTLAERATRISEELAGLGIGPGDRVAILSERTPQMVAALAGVAIAGAAYLPIDPTSPAQRVAGILADAEVRLVFVDAAGAALAGTDVPIRRLDLPFTSPLPPRTAPRGVARPEDPLYVIYTSGSTGRPKGVLVPHRALINWVDWIRTWNELGPKDVVLHRTSPGFDPSVGETWIPLLTGCPMVLARSDRDVDPRYVGELIRTHHVTVVRMVTSMLALLVDSGELRQCPSLRNVAAGGEVLPLELVRRFHVQSSARLVNSYGPTEVTISATGWQADPAYRGTSAPIGRPIANASAYVLDAQMRPQPVGVAGELFLGGPGIALGYHHRPELTSERFVPGPFAGTQGLLYRTGDRVRLLADGNLEYLGRLDDQLKIRGVRIEPAEIEALLRLHPGIVDCAVHPAAGMAGVYLVAYVVARPGCVPTIEAVREWLGRSLPGVMLPGSVVALARLPRTSSRKIDRQALPAPAGHPSGAEPPRTPLEVLVAAVFGEALGGVPVGREDNLFALGGHSLLAMRIATRLRTTMGLDLTLRTVLEHPTAASLAAELARLAPDGSPIDARPVIPRVTRTSRSV